MTILLLIPLLGALLVALSPSQKGARVIGLGSMLAALAFAGTLARGYDARVGGLQFLERSPWIPSFGVSYFVGADGMSLALLLLTAFVVPFAVLAGGSAFDRTRIALVLLLEATLFGTFTALDFILWFLFYELSLVPSFFLIRSAGTPASAKAALQFFVYTFLGGLAMLLGFLGIQMATNSFDIVVLGQMGPVMDGLLDANLGMRHAGLVIFCLVFLGLAVKVPVVPFHTWLPGAYAEAPTPVTMLLTGLMSKMGVYGFLRLLLPIFPAQMQQLSMPLFGLAVLTIVFPAFVAMAQTDLKRILAYSSINHLGYCLLAIFALGAFPLGAATAKAAAWDGAVLQMVNHGLTASALFAFVWFIERRSGGLLNVADFGGLRAPAPVLAGLMGIAIFSSLGLPGLNGFVGEFLIFAGTFHLAWLPATLSAIGLFVTAVFLLNLIQKVFTGPLPDRWTRFHDLTAGEIAVVTPAIALMFVLGIYPQVLVALFNTR